MRWNVVMNEGKRILRGQVSEGESKENCPIVVIVLTLTLPPAYRLFVDIRVIFPCYLPCSFISCVLLMHVIKFLSDKNFPLIA